MAQGDSGGPGNPTMELSLTANGGLHAAPLIAQLSDTGFSAVPTAWSVTWSGNSTGLGDPASVQDAYDNANAYFSGSVLFGALNNLAPLTKSDTVTVPDGLLTPPYSLTINLELPPTEGGSQWTIDNKMTPIA